MGMSADLYGERTMSDKEKTCCFTGHRYIPTEKKEIISQKLEAELRILIEKGYTAFAAGGALGFDTIAAKTVLKLKKEFDHIELILILPCMDQTKKWSYDDAYEYEMLKFYADEIHFIEERYTAGCYQKRNRALVDASSMCIAYLQNSSGGTAYTCNYAKRKGIKVINLAEPPKDEQISLF